MTDRELMQQALDALEGYARNCRCEGGGALCDAAEALRTRLAQPEQEPVATLFGSLPVYDVPPPEQEPVAWMVITMGEVTSMQPHMIAAEMLDGTHQLYTAPPQREWKGLTDEEILEEYRQSYGDDGNLTDIYFAHAIEAKLKDKNEY